MQTKKERQLKILEIISGSDIETQEDLLHCLQQEGFHVTQATISRDIRELRLTKSHTGSGRQKYVTAAQNSRQSLNGYTHALKDGVTEVDTASGIVVLHTAAGMAMAAAAAIDAMKLSSVAGCIAGDDTIFIAVRSEKDVDGLRQQLEDIIR